MNLLQKILAPMDLPYDFDEWQKLPFKEQVKWNCQAWYKQGFGSPIVTLSFYILKMALWVWLWGIFCSYSTELGGWDTVSEWWYKPEAFGKAIVWTSLWEVIGLGGASGPLTARFFPPFGASLYYLRPKTIKTPLFTKAPIIGGDSRNIIDVLFFAALLGAYGYACVAPVINFDVIWPILALLLVCGLLDRTIYLTARADIYFPMMACFLFADQTIPALKIALFSVWFWAAFSKLTPVFTDVVCTMICNNPFVKQFEFIKKPLFRNAPEDLRPSKFAGFVAHFGTFVEFAMPIALLFAAYLSPESVYYILIVITLFHLFIFFNFPLAVPLEWNVIMVLGGFAIFGMYPEVLPTAITNPFIIGLFVLLYLVIPILGNLYPKYISFLLSMRYYAGTWAYSIWLFKDDAKLKVDENVTKTSPSVEWQLSVLYDDKTLKSMLSRLMGFRMLHTPSRLINRLYDKATDGKKGYYWMDGEFFCGEAIGWNFGDGHLHQEHLLEAMQKRCNWESGEVRVIMAESPQLHTGKIEWRIVDAKDGEIDSGLVYLKDLKKETAWSGIQTATT